MTIRVVLELLQLGRKLSRLALRRVEMVRILAQRRRVHDGILGIVRSAGEGPGDGRDIVEDGDEEIARVLNLRDGG